VNHNSAVAEGPRGATWYLLASESVFDTESVVAVRFIEKKVSKPIFEGVIGIVPYHKEAIFYSEGIAEVVASWVACNFGCPVLEVFSIE
jgi:hypothetical protein